MYIVKCNCCGGQSPCDELTLPNKWTSFAVKVITHNGTGTSSERESEDLHACADCSGNMTPDEMCDAISDILRAEMNQQAMANVGADKIDLEDLPPGEIVAVPKVATRDEDFMTLGKKRAASWPSDPVSMVRSTTGLGVEDIIADSTRELELAIRRCHARTGSAHVCLDKQTIETLPEGYTVLKKVPTGEVTITVKPEK